MKYLLGLVLPRWHSSILAAGALQSPALLLLRAIGAASELQEVGIVPISDRPGVSRNLWDYSSLKIAASLTPSAADSEAAPSSRAGATPEGRSR